MENSRSNLGMTVVCTLYIEICVLYGVEFKYLHSLAALILIISTYVKLIPVIETTVKDLTSRAAFLQKVSLSCCLTTIAQQLHNDSGLTLRC